MLFRSLGTQYPKSKGVDATARWAAGDGGQQAKEWARNFSREQLGDKQEIAVTDAIYKAIKFLQDYARLVGNEKYGDKELKLALQYDYNLNNFYYTTVLRNNYPNLRELGETFKNTGFPYNLSK